MSTLIALMFNVRLRSGRIPVAAHQEHTETNEKNAYTIHAGNSSNKELPLLRHAMQMIQSKMQGIASSRWT